MSGLARERSRMRRETVVAGLLAEQGSGAQLPNSMADEEVAAMRQAPRSANGFRIAGDNSDPKLQGVVSCSYSHGRLASR
jgi:hypothetical protein